jgi:uncharacterized protein (TIGR03067 family)
MKGYAVVALVVGFLVGADKPQNDKQELVKKELKKLEGIWKPVSREEGGTKEPLKDLGGTQVIFSGHRFSFKKDDKIITQGTFEVDPSKKPKTIDFTITSEGESKGQTLQGIYTLSKDRLQWCTGRPGKDNRPKEFSTKAKSGHLLINFKRQKS